MLNRYQGAEAGNSDAEHNLFALFAPARARSTWNPMLAVMLKGTADAQEGLGTIATEWQGFLSHRLQQDIMLSQRLAHCRAPEQFVAAYADFWHKAAEDYGKELTTMTKLVTGVARTMVLTSGCVTEERRANSHGPDMAAA